MALFWFLCGILMILAIARYNESNRLFWILLVSFIGAFTATSIIESILDNEKENVTVNVSPTQLHMSTCDIISFVTDDALCAANDVDFTTPVAVSKDYYINQNASSEVSSRVNNPLDKPPQILLRC